MELKELIQLLRVSGVRRYKSAKFEIEFESVKLDVSAPSPAPTEQPDKTPSGLPPGLEDPDTMSYDKIRDWSGSPDPEADKVPLPLTGDQPLDPPLPESQAV